MEGNRERLDEGGRLVIDAVRDLVDVPAEHRLWHPDKLGECTGQAVGDAGGQTRLAQVRRPLKAARTATAG